MHLGRRLGAALLLSLGGAVGLLPVSADDWPQWQGPQRDGIWREQGILEAFPAGGPPVRWRTQIGAGYAGPVVAKGRVYLTDRPTALEMGNPGGALDRTAASGVERVLCLSEADGKVLWRYEYDCPYNIAYPSGPRASPVVSDGKVYTLGAEGHLFCLEANTGRVIWSRQFKKDYGIETQTWGVASQPLVDGRKLICLVGGEGHTVVAFDKETGQELWRALGAKEPGYAPPVIYEIGGTRQLIVWDVEALSSLDPETGKVHWSEPFQTKMGHCIATPRRMNDLLFISSFFDGSLMMRLDANQPTARVLWRIKGASESKPEGLHCLISTPFLEDGYIYGVCSYGHLRCLKAETGERLWETLAATTPDGKAARWATAFIVKQGDRFFLYNEKGDLIIARLKPTGYEEISRTHLLEPTNNAGGRAVHWCHPAFANRCVYVRNDKEIICVDLKRGAGRRALPRLDPARKAVMLRRSSSLRGDDRSALNSNAWRR